MEGVPLPVEVDPTAVAVGGAAAVAATPCRLDAAPLDDDDDEDDSASREGGTTASDSDEDDSAPRGAGGATVVGVCTGLKVRAEEGVTPFATSPSPKATGVRAAPC